MLTMEAQLRALVPFSDFLAALVKDEEDVPLVDLLQPYLPARWSPEVGEQLLTFCQDRRTIVYEPSFLCLANYLMLPGLKETIDRDARLTGNQANIRVVVDACIGFSETWASRFPSVRREWGNDEIAKRGLYYLHPTMQLYRWAEYGWLDVIQHAMREGHPWDKLLCAYAAKNGHLEVLRWANENDCPWDDDVLMLAYFFRRWKVFRWASKNMRPRNRLPYRKGLLRRGNTTMWADLLKEWNLL